MIIVQPPIVLPSPSVPMPMQLLEFPMGAWNMVTTNSIVIPIGMTIQDIFLMSLYIRNDAGTQYYFDALYANPSPIGMMERLVDNSGKLTLRIATDSPFKVIPFQSTAHSRGSVRIMRKV